MNTPNSSNKLFTFRDSNGHAVNFVFTGYELEIEIPDTDKHYSFCCESITNFQVLPGYYHVSLLFTGKISYRHNDRIKIVDSFSVCLEKPQDINLQDIIEANSSLRTPLSADKEKLALWQEKVFAKDKEKGMLRILGIPRFSEWEIYVDDFVFTKTKSAERTQGGNGIYLELPYGEYTIHFTAGGNLGGWHNADGYSGVRSNDVPITLSADNPVVALRGKIGLIRAKLYMEYNDVDN